MKIFATAALLVWSAKAQTCPSTWKCHYTEDPPTLDGDLGEWTNVEGIETPMKDPLSGQEYAAGAASYKCLYDDDMIYFAMSIPGEYQFSTEDNKLCAAIATMMKIGADATYFNMGGCPEAMPGVTCNATLLEVCDSRRVDIGAHWELRGTEQGVYYPVNPDTGNDLIANKDDEYGVSPYCRNDDDDANAGNEWAGAWKHTDPVVGELGDYIFEMSRLLKTPSAVTDAQMTPGETYSFGISYWDPNQIPGTGWTEAGHYVTGCGTEWIDLELATPTEPSAAYSQWGTLASTWSILTLTVVFGVLQFA